jgi:hypothetical protein
MEEWIILYRKGDKGIGFIRAPTDDDDAEDSLCVFDSEALAQAFADGSRFLQTRPHQIMQVTEL